MSRRLADGGEEEGEPAEPDGPRQTCDEEIAIRHLYAANVAALNAKDFPALAALYTYDAIQVPPDRPALRGWNAIRGALEGELTGITMEAVVELEEAVVAGSWAYALGRYRTTVTPNGADAPTVTEGTWLDVLRRGDDGEWRIARSAWNRPQPRAPSHGERSLGGEAWAGS